MFSVQELMEKRLKAAPEHLSQISFFRVRGRLKEGIEQALMEQPVLDHPLVTVKPLASFVDTGIGTDRGAYPSQPNSSLLC